MNGALPSVRLVAVLSRVRSELRARVFSHRLGKQHNKHQLRSDPTARPATRPSPSPLHALPIPVEGLPDHRVRHGEDASTMDL